MGDRICTVDGCLSKRLAKGLCSKHYERQRRHGTTDLMPRVFKRSRCSVESCESDSFAKNLCTMHYQRSRKGIPLDLPRDFNTGPLHHSWKEFLGYSGIHRRLKTQRGEAARYECVDCSDAATEWSYRGGCSEELRDGLAYCPHTDCYEPRCKACHTRFDIRVRGA